MQLHALRKFYRVGNSARYALLLASLCVTVCASTLQTVRAEAPCEALAKVSTETCPRPANLESARGLALGTGVRASSLSTSALAYNPAGLVVGRVYHVEGMADWMADMKTVALGAAIVDSSTSRMAAGLAFRGFLSGEGGLGGIDGRLGLAFPLSNAISLGVSGRYINARRDGEAVAALPASLRSVSGFTMDASLRIVPVPVFMLYGGVHNFINLDSVYAPITVNGGAAFALADIAVIGADVLVDMTSYDSAAVSLGGGAEFFLAQVVPVRAGYSYDNKRDQHTLTLGLGYTDRAMGLDVSLRQDLGGVGDTRLLGAIRVYVQ
jgi:opacity protein-like surface antigen